MIAEVGDWDVQRVESLEKDGVNPDTGREALLRDVDNLLMELNLLAKLPTLRERDSSSKIRFNGLKKRLKDVKSRFSDI